ncbi:uncharacterized protein BDR25DRAFT_313771 [Lindgomyces ingoldianus]|uniref:Uncharacterized protein n=1 Tax=Lindgomyces ingoldianus TaxID=673940 RepID=A0ACB6QVS0_9PLEO|nr:uncharacterized protein BDR25DRAFT_313771 [Lindgomyces ingoldianus]KAF2471139.1 hypothetical protein BDR25DRAFT_313771 [Lindgomyces ingoldianus]
MVKSAWYSNSIPSLSLPEDSYYGPVVEQIEDGLTGAENKKRGMNVDIFAEGLVVGVPKGGKKDVLERFTGGNGLVVAVPAKMGQDHAKNWVQDSAMMDRAGLGKLASARKNA